MLVSLILVSIAKPTHITAWYDSGENAPSALRKSGQVAGVLGSSKPLEDLIRPSSYELIVLVETSTHQLCWSISGVKHTRARR